MKKVVISIINYNGVEQTTECLASLAKIILPKNIACEILVIDNASEKPYSYDKKTIDRFPITVIHNPENAGFAGGHNVSITESLKQGADFVLILNNDTYVDPAFLAELLNVAEKHHKVGIVVPKIYFAKGYEFHKDRYTEKDLGRVFWYAGGSMDWKNILGTHRGVDSVDHGQFNTPEKTDEATGCCMLVKREVFERVGVFDERYFLYLEDSDFNERVKQAGFSIWYQPTAVIWHKNAGSTGGSGSSLQDYFITRNRMLFGMTYAGWRTKLALVRESMRLLRNGRPAQKQGIRDYYQRKFGKGSWR